MQLEGVLSTSQAAKSFMGTGFDALVIFSDLFFSVIVKQHQTTVSQHYTSYITISIVILSLNTTLYSFLKHSSYTKPMPTQTQQYSVNFIARLTGKSQRANRGRSIRLTASCPVFPHSNLNLQFMSKGTYLCSLNIVHHVC